MGAVQLFIVGVGSVAMFAGISLLFLLAFRRHSIADGENGLKLPLGIEIKSKNPAVAVSFLGGALIVLPVVVNAPLPTPAPQQTTASPERSHAMPSNRDCRALAAQVLGSESGSISNDRTTEILQAFGASPPTVAAEMNDYGYALYRDAMTHEEPRRSTMLNQAKAEIQRAIDASHGTRTVAFFNLAEVNLALGNWQAALDGFEACKRLPGRAVVIQRCADGSNRLLSAGCARTSQSL